MVVISEDGGGSSDDREKRSLSSECDIAMLYNSTEAIANNQTCYITAIFDSVNISESGLRYTVGDGKTKRGYYNKPLMKDHSYTILIGYEGTIEVCVQEIISKKFLKNDDFSIKCITVYRVTI